MKRETFNIDGTRQKYYFNFNGEVQGEGEKNAKTEKGEDGNQRVGRS